MISICIPVFNIYVQPLVEDLVTQAKDLNNNIEIIVLDDGSGKPIRAANKGVSSVAFVVYRELEANVGRNQIRKLLAKTANHEWLLFIDADSSIIKKDFLKSYIQKCVAGVDVICGGRTYSSTPPDDCNKMLHWKYGKSREKINNGRFVFMTNNFCIRKEVFNNIDVPEDLVGYGHEDTWLGIYLSKIKAKFIYINNPVLHIGLEEANVFLNKSINAVKNLHVLEKIFGSDTIQCYVKLYKAYIVLRRVGIAPASRYLLEKFNGLITKNLVSCKPSLYLFDLYRLGYFLKLKSEEKSL